MAVHSLEDEPAHTEVHRWRQLRTEQAKLERDMQCILQSIHDAGMEQEWIQIHMELANLLGQVNQAMRLRWGRHGHRP